MDKIYLGNSVYAHISDWMLILTTEEGETVINKIYLEPSLYDALSLYVARAQRKGEFSWLKC